MTKKIDVWAVSMEPIQTVHFDRIDEAIEHIKLGMEEGESPIEITKKSFTKSKFNDLQEWDGS